MTARSHRGESRCAAAASEVRIYDCGLGKLNKLVEMCEGRNQITDGCYGHLPVAKRRRLIATVFGISHHGPGGPVVGVGGAAVRGAEGFELGLANGLGDFHFLLMGK